MTPGQNFLFRYYDFAEQCDDDMDIIVQAIKMAGCEKPPRKIKHQLEEVTADSNYLQYYIRIMDKVTDRMIYNAKAIIEKLHSKKKRVQLTIWIILKDQ